VRKLCALSSAKELEVVLGFDHYEERKNKTNITNNFGLISIVTHLMLPEKQMDKFHSQEAVFLMNFPLERLRRHSLKREWSLVGWNF